MKKYLEGVRKYLEGVEKYLEGVRIASRELHTDQLHTFSISHLLPICRALKYLIPETYLMHNLTKHYFFQSRTGPSKHVNP